MADKKRDILEFFEQTNFEQMIPTHPYFAMRFHDVDVKASIISW
jgi:hypothetical protein